MCRFGLYGLLIGLPVAQGFSSNAWEQNIAREANCAQGLDVLFVQDTTGSLQYSLDKMTAEVVSLLTEIEANYTHTHAGVVEFKDKPIDPMGVPLYDHCYRATQPLTADMNAIRNAYASYDASGGGDLPEASYHALWDVSHDARIGWRPFATNDQLREDVVAARIVIMLTDAQPHFEGSLNMPHFPGTSKTPEEFDFDCMNYDYPSPDIIKSALNEQKIILLSLIARDPLMDAFPAWEWVNNKLLGQPEEFCLRVSDGAVDLTEKILAIFQHIKDALPCEQTTTSSSTIATTPLTTTTSTTTTTTPASTLPSTTEATSDGASSTTAHDGSQSSHCGCHCGCGCGCGCSHRCSGGSAYAPQFIFNIPAGVVSADVSLHDIPEGLANSPAL